ncbi:hypothetical protein ACS0TY_020220 [Phlomoides rotata]
MASSEDTNFKRSFDSTCPIGRSKAQMSVGKILGTISVAAASQSRPHQDGGETFIARSVEKRALLNIDLNVAPPEDGGSKSPAANDGGICDGIQPAAAAVGNEIGLNFNGNCENYKDGIEAHWSKGGDNGFCVVEDEEKEMKSTNIVADSEVESEEKDRKIIRWNTLLEVAKNALLEHEQNLRIRGKEFQNRKRKTSQEVELGGELNRKKRRRNFAAEWDNETEAAALEAPPVVLRSSRGRAVAMPNKYRDSVLDAVAMAEAELPRHNKSGKSATVASTKRKSR